MALLTQSCKFPCLLNSHRATAVSLSRSVTCNIDSYRTLKFYLTLPATPITAASHPAPPSPSSRHAQARTSGLRASLSAARRTSFPKRAPPSSHLAPLASHPAPLSVRPPRESFVAVSTRMRRAVRHLTAHRPRTRQRRVWEMKMASRGMALDWMRRPRSLMELSET